MADPSPANVAVLKRCCRCGKDLTGHKRYKDHFGYWCRSCHTADVIAMRRLRQDDDDRSKAWKIAGISVAIVAILLLLLYFWTQ